ncbi:protein UL148D [Human betaherpesvirus 5]|uniref:UL148D n=1 Tax=Human cytomegalovirus TaxID=10359 RepID=Q6SWV8_HCMV|nr:protein UL148D [Human betaherpesvirus 5]ATP76490.1 protein UL148D [synthetic human betaherpesvirus 5]WNA13164.1 protein UL148D [Cytomegalovirus humanbeta5]AAR31385.1 protein UL148D [Human betaherpesvirus 5]ABV71662.1 UL148D [Human betaherpesvirus 5]
MTAPKCVTTTTYLVKTKERPWWPDNAIRRWWISVAIVIFIGVCLVALMYFTQRQAQSSNGGSSG